jgi:quinol monooxygenase YgiN
MDQKIYFLKLTGSIPEQKQKEFEQTFRFVFNQISKECLEHHLAGDVNFSDRYHFYSSWPSANSLAIFLNSQEFRVLQGAYETLGTLDNAERGELIDAKMFWLR